MTKKRLVSYLVVGILAGLFVSACAGVTSGKFELASPGDVLAGGPAVDLQTIPLLDFAQPAHSAQFTFEKAEAVQPASLQGAVTGQSALESLTQSQMYVHSGRMCSAGYGD